MARLDKKLEVSWSQLKAFAAKKFVGLHSYETQNATEVYIIEDGKPSFWTAIFKAGDPRYDDDPTMQAARTDWVNNFADDANGPSKPRGYDGRDKVQPVTLDYGEWHYFHSIGDDANNLRAGPRFMLERNTAGESSLVWRYRDPVRIAGGHAAFLNAVLGDWLDFVVYAPATPVTPNGGNTGNCNVVNGAIIPAAGNGTHDVNLANASPVVAPAGDGYWDYALAANWLGAGTTSVSASPGAAKYHLFAADVDMVHFVAEQLILGNGQHEFEPQNINASLVLPEWRFKCTLHNEGGSHNVQVAWRVLVSRYWTT